jgi:hypothetical protein
MLTEPPIWAVRARRCFALAAARNRRFWRGISSCPAAGHLECCPIARSRPAGRGSTRDLGPCRPGPNAGVRVPRQRYRKACSGEREPGGNRREPESGNGRRERTGERRTKASRRTAGEGGTNPVGKRETGGEPAGGPGDRESGPKPPGASPGIWGRTRLLCRWQSPERSARTAHSRAPAFWRAMDVCRSRAQALGPENRLRLARLLITGRTDRQ